jgi:tRNA (cmo5U34)-methyltransferase
MTSTYAENALRQVPGLLGLHWMTELLLAERVPAEGRVLVLGAGGGMELRNLASGQPGWRFVGVDPSAGMLETARAETITFADRITFIEGTIEAAPDGPFDGATSILVFHFIPLDQRLETLRALRRRLKPGAPLVIAHMSFALDQASRDRWMSRHAAFAVSNGVDHSQAEAGKTAMPERLHLLAPADEEAMLAEAGFSDIELFFGGFDFRGWVATAA